MTNAVTLKLHKFSVRNANAWFAQAEAQFIVRIITVDSTKYYYVVAVKVHSK